MEFPPSPLILNLQFMLGLISAKEFSEMVKLWKEKHQVNKNG